MTDSHALDGLSHEFVERLRRGERPDPQEYARRYPELSAEIDELFPVLLVMEQSAAALESTEALPISAESVRLAAALNALPEDQRRAVRLYRSGKTLSEIAAALAREPTDAAGLLRRGLRQLREVELRETSP